LTALKTAGRLVSYY